MRGNSRWKGALGGVPPADRMRHWRARVDNRGFPDKRLP